MKVFVGNVPFRMTDKELQELCAPFGQITEAAIVRDRFSGRSRGFGFVTFADKAAGEQAIAALNGKDIQGRALVVNEARPMEARSEGGERSGGFGRRNRY